jgi:hypothetical protein
MTKAVVSKVVKSVPLKGKDLFASIKWLNRKPVGLDSQEQPTNPLEFEKCPVLYSNQFTLSPKDMEGNPYGRFVDYYA